MKKGTEGYGKRFAQLAGDIGARMVIPEGQTAEFLHGDLPRTMVVQLEVLASTWMDYCPPHARNQFRNAADQRLTNLQKAAGLFHPYKDEIAQLATAPVVPHLAEIEQDLQAELKKAANDLTELALGMFDLPHRNSIYSRVKGGRHRPVDQVAMVHPVRVPTGL